MHHIQGENRNQMFMLSLESVIPSDALVRVIDAFVDVIDLKSFGFSHAECNDEGRPPYHPGILMKLYLYGYRYGIRTSRKLEREAQTNLEAMWLLSGVTPRYKTIADFRKNHARAFKDVFRKFVFLLKEWNLIEGQTLGIDSFKIRGQNSLKNNFNDKKIERHLAYIDQKIAEYQASLDHADKEEDRLEKEQKIQQQRQKRKNYQEIREQLEQTGEDQISLIDPDAKAVILHRNIVNVGYNIQASVDAKNKLLVEYNTGEVNDTHALAYTAIESKSLLKVEHVNVLADKGYHTGEEIKQCDVHGITTYVSPRAPSTNNKELYSVEKFIYDKAANVYTCPAGEKLISNGRWLKHSENRQGRSPYRFRRYTTTVCRTCKLKSHCTGSRQNGRAIDRSEYADALEANNRRVVENPNYYRLRQQVTEHIFGTLKRQRGFTYSLVKGKQGVLGEVGMMFIGYNLTHCANIMGIKNLIKALRESCWRIFNVFMKPFLSFFRNFSFLKMENGKTILWENKMPKITLSL